MIRVPQRIVKSAIARWRDLSLSRKLYTVVGIMAGLLAVELIVLDFAMNKMSAARAFVGGESLWSKAQKDAITALERYGTTHDERDYQAFLEYLKVPEGDHEARVELMRPHPDLKRVGEGFLKGRLHPDDIPPVIDLLRKFYWVSYLSQAIDIWKEADGLMDQLKAAGSAFHAAVLAKDPGAAQKSFETLHVLNAKLTPLEERFSYVLGEASRWLERIVFSLLLSAVLMVEGIGLSLTFLTSRSLSRGLRSLEQAAHDIGRGDFSRRVAVYSRDELGNLARSVNQMGELLERSYRDLEERVSTRTREIAELASVNSKLYEEAKAAVRMRDEFLSIASHELKTPLTALTLELQLLAKMAHDKGVSQIDQITQLAERSVTHTRSLTSLFDDLLDLTRIRLGRLEIHLSDCDLSKVVREAVSQFSAEASKRGCKLQLEAEVPVNCHCDPIRISQVTANLISNAIKYAPGKPIEVSVRRENQNAVIEVRDHGPGIAPKDHRRIFDRFERGNNKSETQGLGLGLYIAKQIIEAHQGRIEVQSELGQGATFKIIQPQRPP